MQVQLVVSVDCPPCRVAEAVWRKTCTERGIALEAVDISSPTGDRLRNALDLRTVPAVVIGGMLVAVGVQSQAEVTELLREHGGA